MKAILTEFHGWRGLHYDRDLFDRRVTVGFVTIFKHRRSIAGMYRAAKADRDCAIKRMNTITVALKAAAKAARLSG